MASAPPESLNVATRKAKDENAQLSEIIDVLNERFGTEFTRADQLLFDQFVEAAKQDDEVVQGAHANALDDFALAMKPMVEGLMCDRKEQNQEIVTRYLNDARFQEAAFRLLVKRIYDEIRGPAGPSVLREEGGFLVHPGNVAPGESWSSMKELRDGAIDELVEKSQVRKRT